jgi:hypothetical protein
MSKEKDACDVVSESIRQDDGLPPGSQHRHDEKAAPDVAQGMKSAEAEGARLEELLIAGVKASTVAGLFCVLEDLIQFRNQCRWIQSAHVDSLIACLVNQAKTLSVSHGDLLNHGLERWNDDGRLDLGVWFATLAQDKATNADQLVANFGAWELFCAYTPESHASMQQCIGKLETLAHSTRELLRVVLKWERAARLGTQHGSGASRLSICGIVRCLGKAVAAAHEPEESAAIERVCASIVERLGDDGDCMFAGVEDEDAMLPF